MYLHNRIKKKYIYIYLFSIPTRFRNQNNGLTWSQKKKKLESKNNKLKVANRRRISSNYIQTELKKKL